MRCNQEMYGHINCDRDVILGERYCKFHFVPSLRIEIEKLQVENAKLKRCVEFYADEANQIAPIYKHDGRNRPGADFTAPYRMDEGKRARQVLKELEDK